MGIQALLTACQGPLWVTDQGLPPFCFLLTAATFLLVFTWTQATSIYCCKTASAEAARNHFWLCGRALLGCLIPPPPPVHPPTLSRRAKKLTEYEKWEYKQLMMSGVLDVRDFPLYDEENGMGVLAQVDEVRPALVLGVSG